MDEMRKEKNDPQFTLLNWAKSETGIAVMNADTDDEKEAIQAAFRGFKEMLNFRENTTELGWQICLKAMIQFMNEQPLTVITGADGEWILREENNGDKYYISNRLNTLYKLEHEDGSVEYNDINRYLLLNVNDKDLGYFIGGLGGKVFNDLIPIEFPYFPIGRYKVFIEEFKYHKESLENDTYGVLVIRHPDGKMVNVNRFFKKRSYNGEWVEIDKVEYISRKNKVQNTNES